MATTRRVAIAGQTYQLALDEELVRSGARSETVAELPVTGAGGVYRRAFWSFAGPMGQSRSYEDALLPDYAVRLDHRYHSVLTNGPTRNSFSLIDGAPQAEGAIVGEHIVGDGTIIGGIQGSSSVFAEVHDDDGAVYALFEDISVRIAPRDMTVLEQIRLPAVATDLFSGQDGRGYVAFGAARNLSRRSAGATPHTYTGVLDATDTAVKAAKGVTAGFRTFISDPATREISFTVDGFQTLSGQFPIGPTDKDPNGLGSWNGFTFAGYADQISSFTELGDAHPLLTTPLRGLRDVINGSRWVEQWGWFYTITRRGIYRIGPRDYALVGIERLTEFEGPVGGVITGLEAIGESLIASYITEAGDTHIVRGEFNPELTPGTGAPDWFAFDTIEGVRIRTLGSTGLRDAPTLIAASTDGIAYWWELGRRARAISDPDYPLSTLAGEWYGATLSTEPNRIAFPYSMRFTSEHGAWALDVSVDESEFVEFGSIDEPGYHRLTGSGALAFHTLKPRLVLAEGGGRLRGILELEYLERPERAEYRQWTLVQQGDNPQADWAHLLDLLDPETTRTPVTIETPEGQERLGWVAAATLVSLTGPTDGYEVEVLLW